MSRPRAIFGALLLPLTALAQTGLMAVTWLWVLLADIVPTGIEAIRDEWRKP